MNSINNCFLILGVCSFFLVYPCRAQELSFGGSRSVINVKGYKGFIVEPPVKAEKIKKPWVWYAPTIGKYPNKSTEWILEKLVKQGFYVCGVDVGETWGSPEGRKLYTAFYNEVRKKYHLNKKACLIPQSRGGLMLYNWAEDRGNARKVSRIAGIYPIGDFLSCPGLEKTALAFKMNPDSLLLHAKENNPIDRLQSLRKAKVKIFHIHGDADIVVPLINNSQVIVDRYKAMGGDARLKVIPGKGHAEIPEYFESQELLDFLLEEIK